MTEHGYYGNIKKVSTKDYLYILFRTFITYSAMVLVPWYIMTIDREGEETALDLIKDFAALVIIVDIDNLLSGLFDLEHKLIEAPAVIKDKSLDT